MRTGVPALLTALATGCAEPPAPAPAPAPPPYEVGPVVAEALDALLDQDPFGEPRFNDNNIEQRVWDLLTFHAGARGDLRSAALDDVRQIGADAILPLANIARADWVSATERDSAVALLSALDGPWATEAWLDLAQDDAVPAWVRSHAYYQLGTMSEDDSVIPRLLRRLKYEKDHEAFVWLCAALSRHHNHSGLERLLLVWAEDPSDEVRALAEARLIEISSESGHDNAGALRDAWDTNTWAQQSPLSSQRSPRWELEVWRWIDRLDEFQLRGVDDARYLLSRCGPAAAPLLGRALRDERVKVRVHAAQALERMGPRGEDAHPALIAALDEPGVAPTAASALGAIATARNVDAIGPALAARLEPAQALGLRVAAARALGEIGIAAHAPALRGQLGDEVPPELRQACAEGLARVGLGDEVVPGLLTFIEDPLLEATSSEQAVRAWLLDKAEARHAACASILLEWDAVEDAPPGAFPTVQQTRAASARRVALVRARLDDLIGP